MDFQKAIQWRGASPLRMFNQNCGTSFVTNGPMDVDKLVRLSHSPAGSTYVILGGGDLPEVQIGPEANPSLAKELAEQLKVFLHALLAKNE
jgi:hypothetical protein